MANLYRVANDLAIQYSENFVILSSNHKIEQKVIELRKLSRQSDVIGIRNVTSQRGNETPESIQFSETGFCPQLVLVSPTDKKNIAGI
jgi:hypothetical protein